MIDVKAALYGVLLTAGGTVLFWALCRTAPGYVTSWARDIFLWAKTSPWWRDATRPKRARLLLALVEFLEDEIPDPGTGKSFYAGLGESVAAFPARLSVKAPVFIRPPLLTIAVFMTGTGPKWAEVLEKTGDALDTELDVEIKELAAAEVVTPKDPPGV